MALDGGEVGHSAQVHALLHARGSQLGPAGLTTCHDVHLVAEDRDVAGGDGAGRDMHDGGELQAGDAVHRRDHQHQALGRGEGRGERAGLQRALDAGDGAGLGLHLDQADRGAENILSPVGGPLVHVVGHGARRGDGIDGCDFGKRVTCVCGGFIAVHGFSDHKQYLLRRVIAFTKRILFLWSESDYESSISQISESCIVKHRKLKIQEDHIRTSSLCLYLCCLR